MRYSIRYYNEHGIAQSEPDLKPPLGLALRVIEELLTHYAELLEGEPSSVSLKLNRASLSQFVKIEFRDYTRKARSSENVDYLQDFIDWHSEVSEHILRLVLVPVYLLPSS